MTRSHPRRLAHYCTGLLAGLLSSTAVAQTELDPITVTATRTPEPSFDVPASVDGVPGAAFNTDTLGVNLSEGLSAVPGLIARNRQNYAQDLQISIRAFGARSTFGIRGVRLYLDGIPATQPDGQGQVSHFNLATAERVEVLRGPFSALYGNSSGGVIQLFTADGSEHPQLTFGTAAGSYGTWRANLVASGKSDIGSQAFDYNLGYTRFETDGFRDHSAAERDSLNGKLNLQVGTAGRLTLLLNVFASPDTQDPLGLTRAQFEEDPSQATAVATQFNTRKSVDQSQGGAVYEHRLGDAHTLRLLGYGGRRQIEQYLAIPPGPQGNPTHSGGVIDLDSGYAGLDARWSWRTRLARRPLSLTLGLSYDDLRQERRGYENFVGEQLGVRGARRRDETNDVYDFDQYLQAGWAFSERWTALAGLRHSRVKFESDDQYVTDDNPDDSGSTDYARTTPVGGLMYRHSPVLHLYAAYGTGFETPTLVELVVQARRRFGPEPRAGRGAHRSRRDRRQAPPAAGPARRTGVVPHRYTRRVGGRNQRRRTRHLPERRAHAAPGRRGRCGRDARAAPGHEACLHLDRGRGAAGLSRLHRRALQRAGNAGCVRQPAARRAGVPSVRCAALGCRARLAGLARRAIPVRSPGQRRQQRGGAVLHAGRPHWRLRLRPATAAPARLRLGGQPVR